MLCCYLSLKYNSVKYCFRQLKRCFRKNKQYFRAPLIRRISDILLVA